MPFVRTALVTGASRGLGLTLSTFLAAQGYSLIVTARDAAALEESAERLRAYGGTVVALAGDVIDPHHHTRLARAARDLEGLDLLVNNASTLGPSPLPNLQDYPLDDLRVVLEANLIAPLALIQETLPLLQARRGLIVNLSSDAALGGYAGWGAYGSSKAALDLVTKTLANEVQGVTVVSVDPGDMRTQMHQQAFPGEDISDRPLPEVTLPFWAWLLGQPHEQVNGRRFSAQAERWEHLQQHDQQHDQEPTGVNA